MPRGKKSCPKCHAEVGPRLRVCECGFEFTFKAGKEPKGHSQHNDPAAPLRLPPKVSRRKAPPKIENPDDVSPDPPKSILVSDRDELLRFMAELKSCYDKSKANAGGYRAFLHHKLGVLAVHVCLKAKE